MVASAIGKWLALCPNSSSKVDDRPDATRFNTEPVTSARSAGSHGAESSAHLALAREFENMRHDLR